MNDYDLWFTMLKIPNRDKLNLIKQFGDTKEIWYRFINEEKFKEKFCYDGDKINKIKEIMIRDKISTVFYNDDNYPKALKVYEDMPIGLFYKGNIEKLNSISNNIAIVGSRKCTHYGIDVTRIICRELAKHDIGIISGMARGIDSYAQAEYIENGGYTCAILGCGANVIYPRENKSLYCNIIKNGCIISQYEPDTKPLAYNFPVRNAIISGLSKLVVVIEAGIKSGSLITATYALEQGKDVGAVPGSIFSQMSLGTNMLIKEGAHPITKSSDIFEILGLQVNEEKDLNCKTKCKVGGVIEKNLYSLITDIPIHIDDIKRLTNIDIKELYELLFEMQLKNEILCLSGNYYVRINDTF